MGQTEGSQLPLQEWTPITWAGTETLRVQSSESRAELSSHRGGVLTWGPLLPLRVQHPGKEPELLGGQSVPWERGVVATSGRGMAPDLLWLREVGKLERVWGL